MIAALLLAAAVTIATVFRAGVRSVLLVFGLIGLAVAIKILETRA